MTWRQWSVQNKGVISTPPQYVQFQPKSKGLECISIPLLKLTEPCQFIPAENLPQNLECSHLYAPIHKPARKSWLQWRLGNPELTKMSHQLYGHRNHPKQFIWATPAALWRDTQFTSSSCGVVQQGDLCPQSPPDPSTYQPSTHTHQTEIHTLLNPIWGFRMRQWTMFEGVARKKHWWRK